MDPRHLFADERHSGMCVFCGGAPETRDHVPSRVLLDEPLASQLPVVDACSACNVGFSLDEQYLACYLECVIGGSTSPVELRRPKIVRILEETPALRDRIESSRRADPPGRTVWQPEIDRVRRIIVKLARGHVAYELFPCLDEPEAIAVVPLPEMSGGQRAAFEETSAGAQPALWPEIGTRAFFRALGRQPDPFEDQAGWIVVQPGRYRYRVVEDGVATVRIVLSEYLACEVAWT